MVGLVDRGWIATSRDELPAPKVDLKRSQCASLRRSFTFMVPVVNLLSSSDISSTTLPHFWSKCKWSRIGLMTLSRCVECGPGFGRLASSHRPPGARAAITFFKLHTNSYHTKGAGSSLAIFQPYFKKLQILGGLSTPIRPTSWFFNIMHVL